MTPSRATRPTSSPYRLRHLPIIHLAITCACALALLTSCGTEDPASGGGDSDAAAAKTAWLPCGPADGEPVISSHAIGELANMDITCQGTSGPVVLLLHGFPDFAYGWTKVMRKLAKDHIVIAPDQRGYHKTSGPDDVDGYKIDKLVGDIEALVKRISATEDGLAAPGKLTVVGHDWGGAIAWTFGHKHPDLLSKLVIINGPHPDVFIREYNENPEQKNASAYMAFFSTPGSEGALMANEHKLLVDAFGDALLELDKLKYRELFAASKLTRMLNWYRANIDTTKGTIAASDITIKVPTLVAWGMKDTALLPGNLVGLDKYVEKLTIQHFPTATHWVPHEQPAAIATAVREFTAGLPVAPTATEI